MRLSSLAAASSFVVAAVAAASCGDSAANSEFGPGSSGASGGASGGAGSSGFGSSGSSGSSGEGGTSGSSGAGSAEVCDGIDNDGNGIIDDVDRGGDGICDCLRIATLGIKGQWGDGDVFATWLNGKSDKGAVPLADQVLTPALLAGYQVIVAQDVRNGGRVYGQSEIDALRDWVKGGGGLLTLIGYADETERTNINALLGSFGMSYAAAPILQKTGGNTVPVTTWTPAHPVTDGITLIGVDNGYEVSGTGVTLATETGLVMLKGQEVDKGHVLVWGDEWITYNSEWNTHPEYQVARLWVNMIKWLTPAKECQVPVPVVVN